ncbi:MAG: hypothetical protein ACLS4R_09235 [Roseburia inulinivorans]|jgi:hypothetical protein
MMKKRFHVKKRTLLLIAGIVWLIAGFNVARLGILSYRVIDRKWYLYLFSVVFFSIPVSAVHWPWRGWYLPEIIFVINN